MTKTVFRKLAAGAAFVAAFGSTANAQAANCDPVGSVSGNVGKAQFSMTRAMGTLQSGGNPTKDVQDVIRTLGDGKNDNPVARNYLLGQAYVILLMQPNITPVVPRSALGLTTNQSATVNLFAAADSAFTIVEKASPACATLAATWRQQKPWLNALNGAINALNAGQLDSAEVLAKRALTIDRRAPYAYSVLGSVAERRKNFALAAENWKLALAATGNDTAYADVKSKTLFDIANYETDRTDAASSAEKRAQARVAIKAWRDYLDVATSDNLIAEAMDREGRLYVVAGDSASASAVYAAVLGNTSKYGEQSLVHAGVVANRAGKPADAARLFEAGLLANPVSRDALNNLAASYIQTGEYSKAFPLIDRLIALDPDNPSNVLLYAFAYQGLYKGTKVKKTQKIYTDSLVFFNARAENAPAKLTVTNFSRGDTQTVFGGTIENLTKVKKTYSLSVDFLDKNGAVVASDVASVGPVAPGAKGTFRVTVPKGGVYGFRYKPLG